MIDAVKEIATEVKKGSVQIEDINESMFSNHLYTKDLPDLDLLIRTSGELRISNFLLWQLAYSELYFPKVHWPAFDKKQLLKAIDDFQKRNRRFGGLKKEEE
jgi:undecaprenyl diphosphate synthase